MSFHSRLTPFTNGAMTRDELKENCADLVHNFDVDVHTTLRGILKVPAIWDDISTIMLNAKRGMEKLCDELRVDTEAAKRKVIEMREAYSEEEGVVLASGELESITRKNMHEFAKYHRLCVAYARQILAVLNQQQE